MQPRHLSLLFCSTLSIVATGCLEPNAAESGDLADPLDPSEAWVAGELLDTITIDEGHFVEFWESEPGVVFVRESASLEDDLSPTTVLGDLDGQALSVADIYRRVADDPTVTPPASIRDASARVDAMTRELAEIEPPPDLLGDDESGRSLSGTERACSPDYFNDNWSDYWFLTNFCTEGSHRWCPTNVSSASASIERTTWWKGVALAADFYVGALYYGEYYVKTTTCFLGACWDSWAKYPGFEIPMVARKIEIMMAVGVGYRYARLTGNAPCPRVHFAKMVYL